MKVLGSHFFGDGDARDAVLIQQGRPGSVVRGCSFDLPNIPNGTEVDIR